jgi:hypothetical protein
MLTNGRVGEPELVGQLGCRGGVGALEPFDDAALGARQVGGDLVDAGRIAN